MPSTSGRLGLLEPVGGDGPSELRLSITNHATTLDGAVLITEGTLASRPATPTPNTYGVTYYATDTGVRYFWNGSAWMTYMLAGAWQNLTLGSGVTAAATGYTPQVRVEGDIARLRGNLTKSTGIGSGTTIATLPAGTIPAQECWINAIDLSTSTWASAQCQISTGGSIVYVGPVLSASASVGFDNSYPIS